MNMYPVSLEKLINQFERLPGIGHKSAVRLAYHVLNMPETAVENFADCLLAAKSDIRLCKVCQNITDKDLCDVCTATGRDKGVICVVETPKDLVAMEKTGEYRGLYHVLHGALSPMDNVGVEDIKLKELMHRLTGEVEEVILATNPTVEGETTAAYAARLIKPLGIKVTRIAHGIPVGGDIEYADEVTLARALEGRREL